MTASVAIITRTKDRPRLLRRAIESVLLQSQSDWCHVIVNDGGDAAALEAMLGDYRERYDGRMTLLHHQSSRGMQVAANAGITASSSTFLCIHDDDDSWDEDFLKNCVTFLENEGAASPYQGVITRTLEVRETINAKGEPEETDRRPYLPLSEVSLFRLGYENPFPPIAFCYRRSAFEAIGPYNPRFSVAGDYDFNFRFLRRFEIGVVDKPLAFYHVRAGVGTAFGNSVVAGAGEHKRRYNEFKNHYLRGDDPAVDPALAAGLNAAKYLVELEWLTYEIRQRTEKIEGVTDAAADRIPAIESQLSRSLQIQDEAFSDLRRHAEDPRTLDQLAIALRELAYLTDVSGKLAARGEELARTQQSANDELLQRTATTLQDLAYLNGVAGQISARAEELAHHHDSRASEILREIQSHHTAMTEAQREKVLLQIGSFRMTWKKNRRRSAPEA